MELREWAIRILSADTLEEKLFIPDAFTDNMPGTPLLFSEPVRPPGMQFKRHTSREKLPPFHEHRHPDKRAVCLHRFAGHELLAVEIMAHALIAFPDAPKHFRRGVAGTLCEEQEHVRLYVERMQAMGLHFGDLPLYRHFWAHVPHLTCPIRYVSVMSLTFEMANLDFAPMYGKSFAGAGDKASAALMQSILKDEIKHVAFGVKWLKKLKKDGESQWDAWEQSLPPLMTPARAKGFILHEDPRRKAGVSEEWIQKLKKS
jgi:uncharacterized ferritin-like protein (DUF455 family)